MWSLFIVPLILEAALLVQWVAQGQVGSAHTWRPPTAPSPPQRIGGHAKYQHTRLAQLFLDLRQHVVARLKHPVIAPHPTPVQDVGVAHCRSEIVMTQESLESLDVVAVLQPVSCEGMAEGWAEQVSDYQNSDERMVGVPLRSEERRVG